MHSHFSIPTAIAALCVLGLVALVVRAVRVRKGLYFYDVKANSVYDFSRTGAREIGAQVRDGRLLLPPKARPGDSIFVAVRIRATLPGHWFEPHLEIDAGSQRLTQAFERGGAGLRYINLSSLDVSRESTVRLDGKFLHIADQAVMLYYISSALELDQQRILLISPHPDDAEIAAFGSYSNRDAHVVTVTAGEGGEPAELGSFAVFGGANAYIEKGKTRAWNSVTVPMLGGVSIQRTANLGYFDETLQAMQRQPTVPVTSLHTGAQSLDAFGQAASAQLMIPRAARPATWNNLVEDLVYVIEHVNPAIIVTPYPRLDGHPDHKMSTAALLEALRKLNWKRGSLLLYTNHSVSSLCYPYGPAGDVISLPPGGSGVLFDGLLSIPLNIAQQQRKRVALDAMNDLRPGFPSASPANALRQLLRTLRIALSADDQSYFRRAVRSNELFFEVRASSLYEPGATAAILGSAPAP
jgi:LmbE family N-acetylglucosaminyl deacetylase